MKSSRSDTLPVDPRTPDEQAVLRACETLLAGGLIVGPTDTRYGLMVCADNQNALDRLFRVKGRDTSHPVAILVRSREELATIGELTESASQLADSFLPGPLTLVMRSKMKWPPPRVVDGKVGVRLIDLPLIRRLLDSVGCPLAASSANRTGQKDSDSVQEIRADLGDEIDLYLDAGPLTGPASTVVDCTGAIARVLREGAIASEMIGRAIGEKRV
jgi:L-threonylcarbamoyladenylate synthase